MCNSVHVHMSTHTHPYEGQELFLVRVVPVYRCAAWPYYGFPQGSAA